MIDKGRIRRGPLVVLAGLGGAGAVAAGVWLAAGPGSSLDAKPAAQQAQVGTAAPSPVPSPTCPVLDPTAPPSPVPLPPGCAVTPSKTPPSAEPVPSTAPTASRAPRPGPSGPPTASRTPTPVPSTAAPAPSPSHGG
ncbi:hypothetical protein E1293_25105 [Actinomadura darangshiensis]|uniref:Uncharacterized protein n=1 Tax=Actinomadura darangshiensis TaxID=705336 RepID=A0A4R5B1H1_9ACTN|nr:hypothetical protein [Actinomadura darangshiensis]TDD77996.1 hypothetical protein E1293_25105 [Actinomadura darangshiensis]